MTKFTIAALFAAYAAAGGPDDPDCEMSKAMADDSYKGERAAWGDEAAKSAYSVEAVKGDYSLGGKTSIYGGPTAYGSKTSYGAASTS